MIPHQLAPDPPTTHIPLPNEQQSGYRSYQATDNPQLDMSIKSKSDEINQEHQVCFHLIMFEKINSFVNLLVYVYLIVHLKR